jgi:hypothetical protein
VNHVLDLVRAHGNLHNINVWRQTFPDIHFGSVNSEEIPQSFLHWVDVPPEQIAIYVLHELNLDRMVVNCAITLGRQTIEGRIPNPEAWFQVWLAGGFRCLFDRQDNLSADAISHLLYYLDFAENQVGRDKIDPHEINQDLIDQIVVSIMLPTRR